MPFSLTLYKGLSRLIPLAAPVILRRRLVRGKEDPARWTERLGVPGQSRPEGPLIWLNAVGLGEAMALRALIPPLAATLPAAHFLVTSTARSSARAFAGQMPPRTIHQFMPLDAPRYLSRFLDHWRPDLCVWTDQDLWPGAISIGHARGIPQAWVNGRMNLASRKRWRRAPGLLAALLGPMEIISTQTTSLAMALRAIGVTQAAARQSLKPAAPPLACDDDDLAQLRSAIGTRLTWAVGPSYAEDEAAALGALAQLPRSVEKSLLILCPRDAGRGAEVAAAAKVAGFAVALRSAQQQIGNADVYVADTIGEMGLWYRLAGQALIGGSLNATQGHNPWEAMSLGCAVLHGPNVDNFREDYQRLDDAGIARKVRATDTAADIAAAIVAGPGDRGTRGQALCEAARADLFPFARELAGLVRL